MAALTGWFGGKNSMSKWIYSYIPKDIKKYAEVFSGSMAIYFNEDFSHCDKIIFNDFNKLQANFIKCCKDYDKMLEELNKSFENKDDLKKKILIKGGLPDTKRMSRMIISQWQRGDIK